MALTVRVNEKEVCVFVVSISGSLDSATYQELEKKIKPFLLDSTRAIILDLKNLDYISSMGVSVILKTKRVIEELGGSFIMINLPPQISAVFDIIKALPNISLFESLQEADNYLAEMQKRVKERESEDKTRYKF